MNIAVLRRPTIPELSHVRREGNQTQSLFRRSALTSLCEASASYCDVVEMVLI